MSNAFEEVYVVPPELERDAREILCGATTTTTTPTFNWRAGTTIRADIHTIPSSSVFYKNEEQLRVDNLIKERDKKT